MRINGKEKIIAGRISPSDALTIYYRKKADQTTQQNTPEMTQQITLSTPATGSKTQPLPVQAPTPLPSCPPSLTVEQLKDKYLDHKTRLWRGGEFAPRSLMSVKEVLPKFSAAYPKAITDLTAENFRDYRDSLTRRYKPNSINRHVTSIRAMFAWAYRNHIIPDLPKWGDGFEKPSAKHLRRYREKMRQANGEKMYEPAQIRRLLTLADPQLKAMILLGVNCAMGNTDIARLPITVIDLKNQVIDYPRPKTGELRVAPLWPETVTAIREAIATRPTPKDSRDDNLLFLTKTGLPLIREDAMKGENGTRIDYVSLWFRDLLAKADMTRAGVAFYALRHTFYSVASQTTDRDAVSRIAGHSLPGMAGTYNHGIDITRLKKVSNHVRQVIFGIEKPNGRVITVSSL